MKKGREEEKYGEKEDEGEGGERDGERVGRTLNVNVEGIVIFCTILQLLSKSEIMLKYIYFFEIPPGHYNSILWYSSQSWAWESNMIFKILSLGKQYRDATNKSSKV